MKQDIKTIYHELFDKALEEYNAKQTRKDRIIKDYHDHIRHSRQEKEFHEVIFQIGNKDDTAVGSEMAEKSVEILKKYVKDFEKRNPHLRLFNAVIHLDEATPHIHLDFVPFATNQKRGLSTRVSLSKALEQQGYKSNGKFETCSKLWIDSEKQYISELMLEKSIEWEKLGTEREHLSVLDFKKSERKKELEAIDKEIEKASKKKNKINSVDDIQAKKTLIGDKVTISRTDFERLSDMTKKQIASENKEKKLKQEITELNQKIQEQEFTIFHYKAESAMYKSANYISENESLKSRCRLLEKKLSVIEDFIKQMGLYERMVQFLKSLSQNKDRE